MRYRHSNDFWTAVLIVVLAILAVFVLSSCGYDSVSVKGKQAKCVNAKTHKVVAMSQCTSTASANSASSFAIWYFLLYSNGNLNRVPPSTYDSTMLGARTTTDQELGTTEDETNGEIAPPAQDNPGENVPVNPGEEDPVPVDPVEPVDPAPAEVAPAEG